MTRPIWYRILLSTWALWLAAALTEMGPLGSCPKHGHHGVQAPVASAHVAHQTHAGSAGQPADQQDASHAACTCMGLCCCAPAIALPNASASVFALVHHRVLVSAWPNAVALVTRAPHSLPFANGPPAAPIA